MQGEIIPQGKFVEARYITLSFAAKMTKWIPPSRHHHPELWAEQHEAMVRDFFIEFLGSYHYHNIELDGRLVVGCWLVGELGNGLRRQALRPPIASQADRLLLLFINTHFVYRIIRHSV